MKINNYSNRRTAFKGDLRIIGKYSENIKEKFLNNKTFKKMVEDKDFDIVAFVKSREATRDELLKEGKDDILYKINVKTKWHAKNLFERFLNLFKGDETLVKTNNYHSEDTIIRVLR